MQFGILLLDKHEAKVTCRLGRIAQQVPMAVPAEAAKAPTQACSSLTGFAALGLRVHLDYGLAN